MCPVFNHALCDFCSLVEDCGQALRDCRNPSLDLEDFLRQRSGELKGKEESEVNLNATEKFSYFPLDSTVLSAETSVFVTVTSLFPTGRAGVLRALEDHVFPGAADRRQWDGSLMFL